MTENCPKSPSSESMSDSVKMHSGSLDLHAKISVLCKKGCTAYCLNFSEFQKNQLLLQIFPKIDKRMKFPKVMFSVNVVVSFV